MDGATRQRMRRGNWVRFAHPSKSSRNSRYMRAQRLGHAKVPLPNGLSKGHFTNIAKVLASSVMACAGHIPLTQWEHRRYPCYTLALFCLRRPRGRFRERPLSSVRNRQCASSLAPIGASTCALPLLTGLSTPAVHRTAPVSAPRASGDRRPATPEPCVPPVSAGRGPGFPPNPPLRTKRRTRLTRHPVVQSRGADIVSAPNRG